MMAARPILAAATASLVAGAPAWAAAPWSAQSAGYRVTVTDQDIIVMQGGRRVFSARAATRIDHDRAVREAEGGMVESRHALRLLALAGPYLSLQDETYVAVTPSTHPGGETRLWTIDLRQARDGRAPPAIDLTMLAGRAPLVRAVAAVPIVRGAGVRGATSLNDIAGALAADALADRRGCYEFPADWMSRFAIEGWRGGQLIVRLGLPGNGACRYDLTTLRLSAAATPRLRRVMTPIVTPPARTIVIRFAGNPAR